MWKYQKVTYVSQILERFAEQFFLSVDLQINVIKQNLYQSYFFLHVFQGFEPRVNILSESSQPCRGGEGGDPGDNKL